MIKQKVTLISTFVYGVVLNFKSIKKELLMANHEFNFKFDKLQANKCWIIVATMASHV